MSTRHFIDDLERAGVVLSTLDNRLLIDAPKGIITANIKDRLQAAKLEIIETLQLKKTPAKSKMKVYRVTVRGKSMTVLDPSGKPESEMLESLKGRFGDSLDSIS
tara:strand:+ start:5668 stop:5982 length:315 start_codon:yes stop_codon:yes gene_type:complete